MDLDILHQDILSALPSDPIATKYIFADGRWFTDPNSLLLLNNRIYVPFAGNLCTYVLQYNHHHIFAGHFGQNKTLELVHCGYSWPSLHADVQQFCKSCVTCMWSKLQHHKPVKIVDGGLHSFLFSRFYLIFLFFYFLFPIFRTTQVRVISHAVTSVTNWWRSHKTDHETWENRVEGTRIKWCHTAWITYADLM